MASPPRFRLGLVPRMPILFLFHCKLRESGPQTDYRPNCKSTLTMDNGLMYSQVDRRFQRPRCELDPAAGWGYLTQTSDAVFNFLL